MSDALTRPSSTTTEKLGCLSLQYSKLVLLVQNPLILIFLTSLIGPMYHVHSCEICGSDSAVLAGLRLLEQLGCVAGYVIILSEKYRFVGNTPKLGAF